MPIFNPNTEQDNLPNVGVIENTPNRDDLEEYQQRRAAALLRSKARPSDNGSDTCAGWTFTTRLKPIHNRRIGFRR